MGNVAKQGEGVKQGDATPGASLDVVRTRRHGLQLQSAGKGLVFRAHFLGNNMIANDLAENDVEPEVGGRIAVDAGGQTHGQGGVAVLRQDDPGASLHDALAGRVAEERVQPDNIPRFRPPDDAMRLLSFVGHDDLLGVVHVIHNEIFAIDRVIQGRDALRVLGVEVLDRELLAGRYVQPGAAQPRQIFFT